MDKSSSKMQQEVKSAFVKAGLSSRTHFPGDDAYQSSQGSYFSNQERCLQPLAIVQPQSAVEVSQVVRVVRTLRETTVDDLKLAVRSGGHCVWPGAANIEQGITIDLCKINQVSISEGLDQATIGAGAVWGDVYKILSESDITVPGGRVADVGVGGLTLGGGISFFSPRVGFVCDNVVAYEIILADGTIREVTQANASDLWWALKGGGNNFGIVTEVTLRSFKSGDIFGGCSVYPMQGAKDHIKAFHDFASAGDEIDEHTGVIAVCSFRQGQGRHVFNFLTYTQPVEKPEPLASLTNVAKPVYETLRVTSQLDLAWEQTKLSEHNFQNCYITTTTTADLDMLHAMVDIWEKTVADVEQVPGICWAMSFQALHPATTSKSGPLGGNCMGLSDAPPLIIVLLANFWKNSSDNEALVGKSKTLLEQIEVEAKRRGVYHPFKYMNYAWKDQQVFDGYGAENKTRLQEIARKYDPEGFFQTVLPGGFKLF